MTVVVVRTVSQLAQAELESRLAGAVRKGGEDMSLTPGTKHLGAVATAQVRFAIANKGVHMASPSPRPLIPLFKTCRRPSVRRLPRGRTRLWSM